MPLFQFVLLDGWVGGFVKVDGERDRTSGVIVVVVLVVVNIQVVVVVAVLALCERQSLKRNLSNDRIQTKQVSSQSDKNIYISL